MSAGLAGNNTETSFARGRPVAHRHRVDARQGRSLGFEAASKCVNSLGRSLNFNRHSAGIIADRSRQTFVHREPVDKWPKTDALHHAAHQKHFAP
jgi:hypothetical protein